MKKKLIFAIEVAYELNEEGLELEGLSEAIQNLNGYGAAKVVDVRVEDWPLAKGAKGGH